MEPLVDSSFEYKLGLAIRDYELIAWGISSWIPAALPVNRVGSQCGSYYYALSNADYECDAALSISEGWISDEGQYPLFDPDYELIEARYDGVGPRTLEMTVTQVPEPTTVALLALGIAGIGSARFKRA
jgi:hypothetical protein